VCIDRSNPDRAIIRRWFPRAVIVADRCHPIRLVGVPRFRRARPVCPARGWNRGWRGLLRPRADRLAVLQRERLARRFAEHPVLQDSYELKQRLCALRRLKHQSKNACRRHSHEWLEWPATLRQRGLEPARTWAQTLAAWTEELVRRWRFSRNNGLTEGFPRKMKLLQRRAYGFRSFPHYRLCVIAQCG
jgi:transposase